MTERISQKEPLRSTKGEEIEYHIPVMLSEVMETLECASGKTYLDCTLGDGGHSKVILQKSAPGGRLIALDRDVECIERARLRLEPFSGRFEIFNKSFKDLSVVLDDAGVSGCDGIVMDFGISSYQLNNPGRGFSFKDGPLDMRMDKNSPTSAYNIVNEMSEEELADIFFHFGEERQARRVARGICYARERKTIETTTELGNLVHRSKKTKGRAGIRSETKVFQAIRIAVNNELSVISDGLVSALDALLPGGRLCVISFHSLEDRIVKRFFRDKWKEDKSRFDLLTRKPLTPSQDEVRSNPRSRSAKFRAIERIF